MGILQQKLLCENRRDQREIFEKYPADHADQRRNTIPLTSLMNATPQKIGLPTALGHGYHFLHKPTSGYKNQCTLIVRFVHRIG